ncbi:hypothetical protein BDQ17DRAFT_1322027 [Cyathus striatus]|nr:hypothetical protein BDQ17DRAFT_1322027 [Cyathus striatus]
MSHTNPLFNELGAKQHSSSELVGWSIRGGCLVIMDYSFKPSQLWYQDVVKELQTRKYEERVLHMIAVLVPFALLVATNQANVIISLIFQWYTMLECGSRTMPTY